MDLHAEMILDEYKENLETFEIIKRIVLEQLNNYVKEFGSIVNSVEARIKTEKSLTGKLELKGDKYQSLEDITDIVGARVVTFYADEVDKFAAQVEKSFEVDWDNSVDKRKMHKIDQFGYMSLHYICRIPESMYKDEKHPNVNKYRFEIQLRSNLQHTWATIYHDTGYKNDVEVPREILRTLNSLAGLLEIADNEFLRLRVSLDEYRRKVKSVVADGKFDEIELDIESFNAYIQSGAFDALNERIAQINNMEIEQVPYTPFLKVLKDIRCRTLGDVERLLKEHSEDAYQLALRSFNDMDIDIVSSSVGITNLIIVHILKAGLGEIGVKMLLDYIYGEKSNNARRAKNILENARNAGII